MVEQSLSKKSNAWVLRTCVRELRNRARDRERGTCLEPLVHVLAHYAVLVFLDENELPWAQNGCIWADNRITLLVDE